MRTSDIDRLVLLPQQSSGPADPLNRTEVTPAGLPDPATLARMANEFFAALPDGGNNPIRAVPSQFPPNEPLAVEAPATAPAFPPEISLPFVGLLNQELHPFTACGPNPARRSAKVPGEVIEQAANADRDPPL